MMKKIILILSLSFLFFHNLSYSKDFKLPNITPKDLVNEGYVLHSITPISEEGARVMIYTFIKNKIDIIIDKQQEPKINLAMKSSFR